MNLNHDDMKEYRNDYNEYILINDIQFEITFAVDMALQEYFDKRQEIRCYNIVSL